MNDWYDCFHIQNDSTIYLFSDYSNNQLYNYVVYNPITKEIINRLDKFKKNQGFSFEYSPFHCLDSNLLVSEQYEHTIFSLTPKKRNLYTLLYSIPVIKFPRSYILIEKKHIISYKGKRL